MATRAKLLEDSLLIIWNDRDEKRRLEAMKAIYAEDIHFFESNDGTPIIGHADINRTIAKLQAEWPIEFRFTLSKPSQVNHIMETVSWTLGPEGAPPVATGMDVAVIENDLIKSLYLFLDGK